MLDLKPNHFGESQTSSCFFMVLIVDIDPFMKIYISPFEIFTVRNFY